MPFKNLEHDGGEDFSSSSKNRRQVFETEKLNAEEKEKRKEKEISKAQEDYLNINNDILWDEWD